MLLKYTVNENDNYINLKDLLKNYFEISDRLLVKLKHNKKLFINGEHVSINAPLQPNDDVTVLIDFVEDNSNIVPVQMDLDIIYEDEGFIVINKPAGIPVHPSINHFEDSLSNGVKYYFNKLGLKKIIRPVNRLDKDTSGLIIFAKNEYIQECLVKQIKCKQFIKEYIAICNGVFEKKSGTINAPIARKEKSIIERCIAENGDVAITHYEVVKSFKNYTAVKCILETGRTHQIRLHMKYIGHPILGDTLYSSSSNLINRQALHAYRISFVHPITRKQIQFEAPLPDDMKHLL